MLVFGGHNQRFHHSREMASVISDLWVSCVSANHSLLHPARLLARWDAESWVFLAEHDSVVLHILSMVFKELRPFSLLPWTH